MIKTSKGFKGLKELSKSLDALTEGNFRKNALMTAGRVAMRQILADAIMNAPMLSPENIPKNKNLTVGTLKKSIKYRGSFSKQPIIETKGRNKNKIRPLSKHEYVGMVYTGKEANDYAVALEYGRQEFTVVRIHVFGRKVNPYEATMVEMKPNPYMRKALDDNKDSAVTIFMNELSTQIFKKAKAQKKNSKK